MYERASEVPSGDVKVSIAAENGLILAVLGRIWLKKRQPPTLAAAAMSLLHRGLQVSSAHHEEVGGLPTAAVRGRRPRRSLGR